jgi:hypothetical protein
MMSETKNAARSKITLTANASARPNGVDGRIWYTTSFRFASYRGSVGEVSFMM